MTPGFQHEGAGEGHGAAEDWDEGVRARGGVLPRPGAHHGWPLPPRHEGDKYFYQIEIIYWHLPWCRSSWPRPRSDWPSWRICSPTWRPGWVSRARDNGQIQLLIREIELGWIRFLSGSNNTKNSLVSIENSNPCVSESINCREMTINSVGNVFFFCF